MIVDQCMAHSECARSGTRECMRQAPGLLLPGKPRRTRRSSGRSRPADLRITTELVRFFANPTGNRISFSAQDSEETGGNGLLVCPLGRQK